MPRKRARKSASAPSASRQAESLLQATRTEAAALLRAQRALAEEVIAKRAASLPIRPMPGMGVRHFTSSPWIQPDSAQQALFGSREALYGRALGQSGPGPLFSTRRWELTIANIATIHAETERKGWCHNKADLDARLYREEPHLRQADRSVRLPIVNAPFRLKPANDSRLAALLCDAVAAIMDQLDGFKRFAAEMAVSHGTGYGMQEIVWRPRTVRLSVGPHMALNVVCETVDRLDLVPCRSIVFDVFTDRPWVAMSETPGHEIDPFEGPDGRRLHKAIYHRDLSLCGEPARMGGYMFSAHLLAYLKGLSWERGGITLETYGVATPYAEVDPLAGGFSDEQFRQTEAALADLGTGRPTVVQGFKINHTPVPPSLASLHQQFIGLVNAELSKLITSQTLAMETGGVGSYNASETHLNQQGDVRQLLATLLSESYRGQLIRSIVELNAETLASALAPYCSGEPCSPLTLRSQLPIPIWDIFPKESRSERLKMFVDARAANIAVSEEQIFEECGFRRASMTAPPLAAPAPSPLTPTPQAT